MRARWTTVGALLVLAIGGMILSAGDAFAYGGGAGTFGVYQLGVSFNCNNPDACGGETGGFWGWMEFDETTPHSGDGEFAGCGHTVGGGGPGSAGAGHTSYEVTDWYIAPGSAGPETFYASGMETDRFRGQTVTFSFTNEDTGLPAAPGHHNAAELFGAKPPPGVTIQVQVSYKPAN